MTTATSEQLEEEPRSRKNLSSENDDEENQVNKSLLGSEPKTAVKQPKSKMPLFKKKPAAQQAAAGGGDSSMFDINLDQLNSIMETRGDDLMEKLNSEEFKGVKGILEKLKVDGNKGLESGNEQDLEQRRTAYGRNEIPPKPMKSFLKLCWDALHDMLLVILLVCAIVSIGLSFYHAPPTQNSDDESSNTENKDEPNLEWIEGVAILVAVIVVVLVTAVNDWRKERQFRGLQSKIEKDQQTSVVRDNKVQQIPVNELVVGDLCFIKYGDLLPADGLLVQASDLMIDESSITGETNLIKKTEKEDVGLLSGTHVMEGSGRMVVVGVGLNSQVGRIMSLLGATSEESKKNKKDKKKNKKDKKKGEKTKDDEKKSEKKAKGKSSTKVSPDKSQGEESDNPPSTTTIENETKLHPRVRRLPPIKQSSLEERDEQASEKNQVEKKKSNSSHESANEKANKTKTNSEGDKPDKKKSTSDDESEHEEKDDQQKKKSSPSPKTTTEETKKKKSTSGDESDHEEKDDQQKKKTSPSSKSTTEEIKKKKSTSGDESEHEEKDDQQKKKPGSSGGQDEQKKKSDSKANGNEEKEAKKRENRPTTSSSIDAGVDGEKKQKKKTDKEGKDSKEDGEEKPSGLAATVAEENNDDDDEEGGGSTDGKHKSVLQTKLTKLALYIGYIGMMAAFLTLICLIIRFCITNYVVKKRKAQGSDVNFFISYLIQAITVVVVSVPEGLPLAVTLALAYAVRKMMKDNNLVRHLDACETMGNASTICSDKTGTLTTNRMTVVQSYIQGKHQPKLPKGEEMNKDLLSLLFEAVTVNSNYTSKIEDPKEEGGLPKQIGNKTECALLGLVKTWGGSYDEIRENYPEGKLAKVYTFNSARKMMSTVLQRDDGYRLYTKGAAEMVLTKCKSIIGEDNKPKDLSEEEKKKIMHDVIEKMANDGLRTISIAYRDLGKEKQNWDDEEKIIKDLICIGLVGIEDPVREEVPEAIEKCQKAGVIVRMVTGDNVATARSIATKCGIIKPEDDFLVIEGKEFNKRIRDSSGKISQKKLDEVWPKLRVLARSSPTDKYNLVSGIVESCATQHREVVAVTGDGTNDGPALKRADVGFAMGIQGTDVAKQASDIILTDDNFSSIVKAMMWGRNVYDCIAKFLQFQLTANLSAGVISVVSAAAISSVPLRAVQMLWVNLVMDTLASLALATEPPTEELLNRKPYGRTKSIISPMMMRNILGQSLYQLVIMFIILYAGQFFLDVESTVIALQSSSNAGREPSAQFTVVFNAFVLMTLFNEINSRKLHGERNVFKGIFRNPFFYGIWISCFAAQILIVTFGDKVFSCVRLNIRQWGFSLLFGLGSLVWQQILLFIPIEPFSRCFGVLYRVCCPCIYKKQKKKKAAEEGGDREGDETDERKTTKKKPFSKKKKDGESSAEDNDDAEEDPRPAALQKYSTIGQLTRATVVTETPPIFARYMLRKSVDRLNSEFRVINEFRSRLGPVKDNKYGESMGYKRSSKGNAVEE